MSCRECQRHIDAQAETLADDEPDKLFIALNLSAYTQHVTEAHIGGATLTFDQVVASYTMTCFACPTQYEGRLRDGRWFYFRLRHGAARLGIGPDEGEAHEDSYGRSADVSDRFDGVASEGEFKELFMDLITEYPPKEGSRT